MRLGSEKKAGLVVSLESASEREKETVMEMERRSGRLARAGTASSAALSSGTRAGLFSPSVDLVIASRAGRRPSWLPAHPCAAALVVAVVLADFAVAGVAGAAVVGGFVGFAAVVAAAAAVVSSPVLLQSRT